jgi:hypothetical protein
MECFGGIENGLTGSPSGFERILELAAHLPVRVNSDLLHVRCAAWAEPEGFMA